MEADQDRGGVANPRRCAGCKFLRRRCASDCILAPYFPASNPQRYANVHTVFGNSNITRWLQSLPVQERGPAADAMVAEAHWRVQDPVYGSAGVIHRLQEEIAATQVELASRRGELAVMQQVDGAAAHGVPRQGPPGEQLPPPPPLPAVVAPHASDTVREGDDNEQAPPLMDLDGFLRIDGRVSEF